MINNSLLPLVGGGAVDDGRAVDDGSDVAGRGNVDMVEEEGEGELPNDKPTQKLLYHNVLGNSYLLAIAVYTKGLLHCPSLLIMSAPLTLKEYSIPICSVSVMCCDVVMLVKLMLVAVTST